MRLLTVLFLFVPVTIVQNNLYFFVQPDSFSATGKWAPSDSKKKAAFPNEVEVDCFKDQNFCIAATSEYYVGYPHITVEYLQIVKWGPNGIIATDDTGTCMTVTMQIVFAEKSISSTHSMKQLDSKQKEACNFFGAEKTEVDIIVIKNSARWNKEHTFLPEPAEK